MNNQLESPQMRLAQMSRWYVVSRAIHTIARIGVADHMSQMPTPVQELALKTGTEASALNRLLRFLTAYEIFSHNPNGYALTELSLPLRSDTPNSIKDVLCMADSTWWEAFASLEDSIKTGQSAFFHQHGDDFFSHLSQYPEKQANFDRGMAKLSTYDDEAIAKAYPYDNFQTIADLGAGRGGLLKAIHHEYPHISLTLVDSPSVISQLDTKTYPKEISLKAGDFFSTIPNADAFIFKGVLHDFNDTDMTAILTNCRKQLSKKSTLLIIEQVMPDEDNPHPNKTMDIVMMALLGGRQRTLQEWEDRVSALGFKLQASFKTQSIFTIMAFTPIGIEELS